MKHILASLLFVGLPLFASRAEPEASAPIKEKQRTYLFSRSQLKYGLERDDYLARWVDRPLYLDSALQKESPETGAINEASYRQMQAMAQRYGLDGFAFFPEVRRTQEVYRLTRANALPGFLLLSEFGSSGSVEEKVAIAGMALEHPASYRLDGKVVFTSYGADRKTPGYWKNVLEKMRERHGNHFIFLPAIVSFGGKPSSYWIDRFDEAKITPQEFESVKASLREWLRVADGLYFASTAGIKKDRRFHQAFYRDFIIRAMKETLAEPEFHGKYLGLSANIGHENSTRFGYTQSSGGTKTLRESLEAAIDAQPSVINIPEWDEQNENTSLRPTVYNGLSSLRIMRYYSAKVRHEPQTPLPGDDRSIPNLLVSYRKLLALGERLEIELLNIPDSAPEGGDRYRVRVRLADLEGNVVYTSPELTFDPGEMKDQTLSIPSEEFAGCDALIPTIETTTEKETRSFSDGLHSIGLRPTWNWDYKWVKQPLRDLMEGAKCKFALGSPEADGRRVATVEMAADEPLSHVELLDNGDVVYSHAAGPSWRENDDQVVISLNWQAMALINVDGSVRLQGAPNARWLLPKGDEGALQGMTLSLRKLRVNHWGRQILVAIPRSDLDSASFELDLKSHPKRVLLVRQIVERSVYGVPGERGFNLVFSRYLRQHKIPAPLGENAVRFTASVLPDLPGSVLMVQAVGKSGRIYRSKPILSESGGSGSTAVFSESTKGAVPIAPKKHVIPEIRYDFNPRHGSILYTETGRPFWGILGGYVSQSTGRGGGESRDGTPFLKAGSYPEESRNAHPDWVEEPDGAFALEFDGKGTFVALPQGVVPRRSAFTIEMEIKPEAAKGKEVLLANRSYYPGSITLYLDNGVLKARFSGDRGGIPVLNSRLPLETGKWSTIRVVYDQAHLWFVVNGKASKPFPVTGPGMYDTVSALGGFGDEWFKGRIKSLRILHAGINDEKPTL